MKASGEQTEKSANVELVGIDVGGTFTDFVWLKAGRLVVHKESTTPEDQSIAILRGLKKLGISDGAGVVHGTTVATNGLLEHKGAKTALITTRGFADVLAIGRQNRPHLYRLGQHRPPPLVPADLRLEITERIDAFGKVLVPLVEKELEDIISFLAKEEVESIAVVFLFSFLNPTHENRASQILRKRFKDIHLSVSSELLPEYREFERTSTTVINAYVQPLVAAYLARLKASLGERKVRVMQSSGGAIGLDTAADQAARLVLSGPAGGIVGAFESMRRATGDDTPRLMTFDMGGTSTDVALCPGTLPTTSESSISMLPLRFPTMDIHTVGAGGGSIAHVDAGGVLRVGPQSAGATPGPACYGRGGTAPTVTDANLVLGRLDADRPLGGNEALKLDKQRAIQAVGKIAGLLDVSVEHAAQGILRVANATMERALRKVSVEKGHDPRNYTLVPFGGAGPLHACDLAEALDVKRIFVPEYPGVLSALGLLMADVSCDASVSVLQDVETVLNNLNVPAGLVSQIKRLSEQLTETLRGQSESTTESKTGKRPFSIGVKLDLRYQGQSFELEVDMELPACPQNLKNAIDAFYHQHKKRYGYRLEEPVEVVTLRVIGRQAGSIPELFPHEPGEADLEDAMVAITSVWAGKEGRRSVPCYDRLLLKPGLQFIGPCKVLQYDTTLFVTGAWRGEVWDDKSINLWRMEDAPKAYIQ